MLNFFSLSKINNIKTIAKNSKNLSRFYGKHNLTIIVPNKEILDFKNFFENHDLDYINLIQEEKYISFKRFKELFEEINQSFNFKDTYYSNLGWYFQQAVKLSYYLDVGSSKKLIQIDSDTFIIKKINFFNKNHSIIFFNPHERNLPYKYSCEDIFKVKLKKWKSCTSQIGSMTPFECDHMYKKFREYFPIEKFDKKPEWVSKIIIKSVLKRNKTLKGALISDQDIVASNNILSGAKKFTRNKLLRWGVTSPLTNLQIYIAAKLGFIHITYEDWAIKKRIKKMSYPKFILLILRASIVFLTAPKYSLFYTVWKKYFRV